MALFPVGFAVLVNNEIPATIVEADAVPGTYTVFNRPFARYLVRFADGSMEGFTGDYITAA